MAAHRDLVKAGHWSVELGQDYSFLRELRTTGDYGGSFHVSSNNAIETLEAAQRILQAVHETNPEVFQQPENNL